MAQRSTGDLTVDAAENLPANVVKVDVHTATEAIEIDRQEIDALDSRIIELIQSRHRVSFRIQRRRQSDGGPRTELARETVVIDRYRQGLGPEGVTLVTDILRLCRGPAPEAGASTAADRGRPRT